MLRVSKSEYTFWPNISAVWHGIKLKFQKRGLSVSISVKIHLLRFVVVMVRSNSFGHLDSVKWITLVWGLGLWRALKSFFVKQFFFSLIKWLGLIFGSNSSFWKTLKTYIFVDMLEQHCYPRCLKILMEQFIFFNAFEWWVSHCHCFKWNTRNWRQKY